MSKRVFLCAGLLAGCLLMACSQPAEAPARTSASEPEPRPEGDPVAVIRTSKGNIVIRLLPEEAPKTVEQFINLAKAGFYIRTTFHFVSPGYIHGGDPYSRDNDPLNDGLGNTGEWIGAEFNEEHSVDAGCVGMMRKEDDPDSSSCQFFIALKRKKDWDGKYNIFGDVIEGMEVVEKISQAPTVKNNRKLEFRPAGKQLIRGIDIEYREFEEEKAEEVAE